MSVRMRHPDLDTEYNAQPEQVPHLQAAGWRPVEGQATQGETWPAEAQRFEGQEQIRMRHPDLEGEIVVAASAVPIHEDTGWLVVEPEPEPEPEPSAELGIVQLRAQAETLGVKVDGRWSAARLQQEISNATVKTEES